MSMTNQQGAPEALAHELFTAAQLAPGEGISDAVARIAALVEAQQAAPSAVVALSDDLRDRLVAISEAIADQDDRAAQAMLREILAAPQPSPTPQVDSVTAPAGVAYLDIGAGGYIDLGTDLSNEALSRLPKGRHVLIIAGTYGIDGYTPTPPAQAADSVLEDAARLLRQILAASQDGDSDTHLSAHFVSRIETITKAGGAA